MPRQASSAALVAPAGAHSSSAADHQRRPHRQQRQHAFARQPRRAPLRQRAPRALRLAEMAERTQQPDGRQHQPERQPDHLHAVERRRHLAAQIQQRDRDAEPHQQAVAGAGQGGEEDDREGGMHGGYGQPVLMLPEIASRLCRHAIESGIGRSVAPCACHRFVRMAHATKQKPAPTMPRPAYTTSFRIFAEACVERTMSDHRNVMRFNAPDS